jgi:hypothetical protein
VDERQGPRRAPAVEAKKERTRCGPRQRHCADQARCRRVLRGADPGGDGQEARAENNRRVNKIMAALVASDPDLKSKTSDVQVDILHGR